MRHHIKKALFVICTLCLIAGLITGCKKTGGDSSLLVLNIFPRVGADSLVFGKTYANPSGRNINFSTARFYISDINLISTDGSLQSIAGVILVTPQTTQYILGTVPIGSYKSIQFSIGVDPSLNHVDPTQQTTGSPLALTTMHFSSDSLGYIFMDVEGEVDTSTAGTGNPNIGYTYHVGADSLFKTIQMPDHSASPYNAVFSANGGKLVSINLVADFNVLLRNLNMKTNTITNTTDFPVVADTIAAHIPLMFSYQQ